MGKIDQSSAYERTIELNKQLGLTPRANRYYVTGEGFYGLYDNLDKLKEDLEEIGIEGRKIWKVVHTEPDRNTYKALQNAYKGFVQINGIHRYDLERITKDNSNSLIFPDRSTLFAKY